MPTRKRTTKLSISLPAPMVAWLKAEAKREMGDLSGIIRRHLIDAYKALEPDADKGKK